jgi:hypothetical protein
MTARWSVVAAALGIAVLGGCAQSVGGTPAPAVETVAPATAAPPPAPATSAPPASAAAPAGGGAERPANGCRVTISERGSIKMSGGGRVRSANNAHSFACRDGAQVAIEAIEATGVRFSVDGANVLVAEGATAAVGPYQITTVDVEGRAAEFDVVPSG